MRTRHAKLTPANRGMGSSYPPQLPTGILSLYWKVSILTLSLHRGFHVLSSQFPTDTTFSLGSISGWMVSQLGIGGVLARSNEHAWGRNLKKQHTLTGFARDMASIWHSGIETINSIRTMTDGSKNALLLTIQPGLDNQGADAGTLWGSIWEEAAGAVQFPFTTRMTTPNPCCTPTTNFIRYHIIYKRPFHLFPSIPVWSKYRNGTRNLLSSLL